MKQNELVVSILRAALAYELENETGSITDALQSGKSIASYAIAMNNPTEYTMMSHLDEQLAVGLMPNTTALLQSLNHSFLACKNDGAEINIDSLDTIVSDEDISDAQLAAYAVTHAKDLATIAYCIWEVIECANLSFEQYATTVNAISEDDLDDALNAVNARAPGDESPESVAFKLLAAEAAEANK